MILQPLSGILMSKHLYAFIRISGISALMRQIPEYMFLRTMFAFFDTGESRMRFLADYLAVMTLFAMFGLFAAVLIPASGKKEK